jgi:hypothetical protein
MGGDWGWSAKMLTKSYSMITKTFRLQDKAGFREKFGTKGDPQYVAYPPGGLGLKGIEGMLSSILLEWAQAVAKPLWTSSRQRR